ncbi:hypothetical protein AVEN_6322-1 [Araneus ventricosus]|uniref:Uncharacterized protein n=1 Tax=Araneus ventricosus TaxID=182803 RepID=A0A4Y2GWF6_ARAVE|nr:hypothetical protein AVEN_6322-1 [Araneus ventricosus]
MLSCRERRMKRRLHPERLQQWTICNCLRARQQLLEIGLLLSPRNFIFDSCSCQRNKVRVGIFINLNMVFPFALDTEGPILSRTTPYIMSFVGTQEATSSSLELLDMNIYIGDRFALLGSMSCNIAEGPKR